MMSQKEIVLWLHHLIFTELTSRKWKCLLLSLYLPWIIHHFLLVDLKFAENIIKKLFLSSAGTPPPAYQPHDDNQPHNQQQTVNIQHCSNHGNQPRRPPPTPMDTMPSGGNRLILIELFYTSKIEEIISMESICL